MSNLSELEIKNKVMKYLNKKGIPVTLNENESLIWNYNIHYSNFKIRLYFEKGNNGYYTVRYKDTNLSQISKRKTTINGTGGYIRIYNILIWIKKELDIIAEKNKEKIDLKNKYCLELESYYSRIHNNVQISTSNSLQGEILISITATNKDGNFIYYSITSKNNRYYLNHKSENPEKVFIIS